MNIIIVLSIICVCILIILLTYKNIEKFDNLENMEQRLQQIIDDDTSLENIVIKKRFNKQDLYLFNGFNSKIIIGKLNNQNIRNNTFRLQFLFELSNISKEMCGWIVK